MENAINRGNCADSLYFQQIGYKSIMRPKYSRERGENSEKRLPQFLYRYFFAAHEKENRVER